MHSVTDRKITPEMFFSEEPPARTIGVEDEYDIQTCKQPDGTYKQAGDYISSQAIKAAGLLSVPTGSTSSNYLENGSRLYQDVGHAEYCTPECLGPYQAAAADIAGMYVVSSIVEASGLKHRGIYRISGTWQKGAQSSTNGVHENFIAPSGIAKSRLLTSLLPTYYATRLGSMAGTIASNEYVFSQKASGIGGDPIEWSLARRVSAGFKPMALILDQESDTVGSGWMRLETRFADAPISLAARRHALATTSLILRMAEHEDIFNKNAFDDTIITDPVDAAHRFMSDLKLGATAEVRSGKRMTMLNISEKLAKGALHLAERIKLPDDELDAVHTWSIINDAFRRSKPAKAEYEPYLLHEYGVATKHYWLDRIGTFEKGDAETKTRSLQWDRILPPGNGIRFLEKSTISEPDVEKLQKTAPITRAAVRSQFIQEFHDVPGVTIYNWNSAKHPASGKVNFSDPYGYRD